MQILHREYWNCTGNTSIYTDHICDDEINDKEGEEDMLMILGLILLFLIMIIGGDRGVISLIALVGNMLLLSLGYLADGSGSTGTSGYDRNGNHHFMCNIILSKWYQ